MTQSEFNAIVNADIQRMMVPKPRVINTEHVVPPIPSRMFDWTATEEGYEPGDPVGRGCTEAEAISDLKNQMNEVKA